MKKNLLTLLSLATVGIVYGQRLPQDTIKIARRMKKSHKNI